MHRFLTAKHWQLFILITGVPIGMQFITMPMIIVNPESSLDLMWVFPLLMIISMITLFGWMYSISVSLQSNLPDGMTMKIKRFKIFFFTPMIYILFTLLFMGTTFIEIGNAKPNEGFLFGMIGLIVPLHFFSMFCIFYVMYFTAKTLKSVELQKEAVFSDYIGDFFLLWFHFVGVWVIQPRINRLIANMQSPSE